MIFTLMRIVLQKLGENRFIDHINKWEFDISEHERVTTVRLRALLKTTLLITKSSDGMYRELCMQVNDLLNYRQAEAPVVNHCNNIITCVPMEIGAFGIK